MNYKAWKGSLVELKVITEFVKRGYQVYSPFIQNGPVDCIIETIEGFKKIQIKTADKRNRSQTYYASVRSKRSRKNYALYDIDFIICEADDRYFILSKSDFIRSDNWWISINQYEGLWSKISQPKDSDECKQVKKEETQLNLTLIN